MYIPCSYNRFSQFLSQCINVQINLFQFVFTLENPFAKHKFIIEMRLHFQEIIKRCDFHQGIVIFIGFNISLNQLAGFASTADNQIFTHSLYQSFWHTGTTIEKVQVRFGYQLIDSFQTSLIFRQKNTVIGFLLFFRQFIIKQIPFDTVNNFYTGILTSFICFRKRLHNTMVGNGNGLMPHIASQFNQVLYITQCIICTHISMQMQFHTFIRCIVRPFFQFCKIQVKSHHRQFTGKTVLPDTAFNFQSFNFFQLPF